MSEQHPPEMTSYIQWFEHYTRPFLNGSPKHRKDVQVKIDHTFRVLDEARRITGALDPDQSLTFCVHLGALFHDVGRFPQYARYGTFNDRISVDHGRMSVNVLRKAGVLDSLPDRDRRVVLASVFLHNKPSLPEHLHFRLNRVVRILRDADKLDIFKVILPHLSPDAPENDVITLAVKPHPTAYTPKILERLRQRKPVRYEDMVWMNDLKLMLCGWIYDFNFDVTRQLVGERRYLERLFETLPRTPEFVELAGRLGEDLRRAGLEDEKVRN